MFARKGIAKNLGVAKTSKLYLGLTSTVTDTIQLSVKQLKKQSQLITFFLETFFLILHFRNFMKFRKLEIIFFYKILSCFQKVIFIFIGIKC